jgi:hypothetical protein
MKHLLKKLLFALVVLLSIFILGIFVPMIISLFITMVTEATLTDCVKTAPFILFSIIGIICSAIYINEQVKDLD